MERKLELIKRDEGFFYYINANENKEKNVLASCYIAEGEFYSKNLEDRMPKLIEMYNSFFQKESNRFYQSTLEKYIKSGELPAIS